MTVIAFSLTLLVVGQVAWSSWAESSVDVRLLRWFESDHFRLEVAPRLVLGIAVVDDSLSVLEDPASPRWVESGAVFGYFVLRKRRIRLIPSLPFSGRALRDQMESEWCR